MNARAARVDASGPLIFVGTPNCGKSTLFAALTGADVRVGNYPGTTVERFEATLSLGGVPISAVDLPGIYSLAASSPDEVTAMDAVLGRHGNEPPRLVVAVLDAPRLGRSLYLLLQILELELPVVVALNLMDEAREQGAAPDPARLSAVLGVPVVPVVARTREGLADLEAAISEALAVPARSAPPSDLSWPDALEQDVVRVASKVPEEWAATDGRRRAFARWALLSGPDAPDLPPLLREAVKGLERDVVQELVGARYLWIDSRLPALVRPPPEPARPLSDRIDRFLLHPVFGTFTFLLVMFTVFEALFAWSTPFSDAIDTGFSWLGDGVTLGFSLLPAAPALELLRDLVVEGLIGGVGAVLVFLPQIAVLFFLIAVLEDCGYLARAAHLMDRLLRSAGLPGQAFVPLLSGFACAVPAIIATRTMARSRDRLLTMLVLPLTTCSARLPVYTLVIAALFPPRFEGWPLPAQASVMMAMYLFSTAVTLVAAVVLGRFALPDKHASVALELPPYRVPYAPTVWRAVKARSLDFVREAGRVILVATVLLWAMLALPRTAPEEVLPSDVLMSCSPDECEALARPYQLERSLAGRLGKVMEPAIAPLGYDWRIGVGLIGSFAAREVFVSTMGLVYGVGGDVDERSSRLHERIQAERRADGTPRYTPLVGASLMVFFSLAMQCLSTLAVLRRETGGWRWPLFVTAYTLALAWCGAFVVYQGGFWLGLGT